jgi:serine/threonine-protein kinase
MNATLTSETISRERSVPSEQIAPGGRLRDYEVIREVGSGGMGTVFEARHTQLGHRAAIKIMHARLAGSVTMAERFLREGRNMARIRHPNVVRVFDVGTRDGRPYLVMDLLVGVDLATLLKRDGPLALERLVEVALPVISAVAAAHELGIIHRDIKPANVVLCADPPGTASKPFLLDFGISKDTRPEQVGLDVTGMDGLVGTLPYMSPEQTRSPSAADPRSDQYALGVLLYECATGSRPFHAETSYDLIHAIRTARIDPPSKRNPALPPGFDRVVLRALSRDPAQRFASVGELGSALARLGSPTPERRRSPRARRMVGVALGAALALTMVPLLRAALARPPLQADAPEAVERSTPPAYRVAALPAASAAEPSHAPAAKRPGALPAPVTRASDAPLRPMASAERAAPVLGTNLAPILE